MAQYSTMYISLIPLCEKPLLIMQSTYSARELQGARQLLSAQIGAAIAGEIIYNESITVAQMPTTNRHLSTRESQQEGSIQDQKKTLSPTHGITTHLKEIVGYGFALMTYYRFKNRLLDNLGCE